MLREREGCSGKGSAMRTVFLSIGTLAVLLLAGSAAAEAPLDAQPAAAGPASPPPQTPMPPAQGAASSYEGPLNTLTVNSLGLLIGSVYIEYERALSERLSWYAGPSYFGLDPGSADGDWTLRLFRLSSGVRLFLLGRAPEGLFLGPEVSVGYIELDTKSTIASATTWSAGGMLGYTWLIGDLVDLSLGLGLEHLSASTSYDGETYGSSGLLPMLRLSIGAAF